MTNRKEPPYDAARAFGAEVARRRSALGWTQKDLGKHTGLAVTTLYRIEHALGKTPLTVAAKVAKALGVPLAELFPSKGLSPAALEAARLFDAINDPALREAILELMRAGVRACTTQATRAQRQRSS